MTMKDVSAKTVKSGGNFMQVNKYIVFKRDNFLRLMGELALPPYDHPTTGERAGTNWECAAMSERIIERCSDEELVDAVVIRRQDIFAAPAFEAYANAITCVIDAMKVSGITEGGNSPIDQLRVIADYFHDQSEMSYYAETDRKLPD